MDEIARAVALGLLVMLAGTIPRNLAFAANLQLAPGVPWAVPVMAVYLWFFWRYLAGAGPPRSTAKARGESLRANRVPPRVWTWSVAAGGLGIVTLVIALRVLNRIVQLPPQQLPDLSNVPRTTVFALLLMAAPIAGIVEEAAFRGYMQGPIERRQGLPIAILVTGTMFAVAHLDFTPILWPYYVAVAAIYGIVTARADSILPAVVLHTAGNLYSNLDLLLHGQAEWQASGATASIWHTGVDRAFVIAVVALAVASLATWLAYRQLARSRWTSASEGRSRRA